MQRSRPRHEADNRIEDKQTGIETHGSPEERQGPEPAVEVRKDEERQEHSEHAQNRENSPDLRRLVYG